MDWAAIGAIAGIVAVAVAIWNKTSIQKWLEERRKRNRIYNHLSDYERDILKALCDIGTTQIVGGYDEDGLPSIYTMLGWIPGAPVSCGLKTTGHYLPSLESLATHGFLKYDRFWSMVLPWRYDPSQRHVKAYRLTRKGFRFTRKYAIGVHWGEKFIRKYFKGLNKHKYKGHYCDKIGADARRKLPKPLRGTVWLKKYDTRDSLGISMNMYPTIYEYPIRARQDGVECMVEIPLTALDVAENDPVFLAIHTRNKPKHLKFDPKVTESFDSYWVQAEVISIKENDYPEGTVINLGNAKPYDPGPEISRH